MAFMAAVSFYFKRFMCCGQLASVHYNAIYSEKYMWYCSQFSVSYGKETENKYSQTLWRRHFW